ncbi:hypothetical protein MMC13_001054 [Lambiella insularis]|nr:hypothetical protein [Lambiella insularis]
MSTSQGSIEKYCFLVENPELRYVLWLFYHNKGLTLRDNHKFYLAVLDKLQSLSIPDSKGVRPHQDQYMFDRPIDEHTLNEYALVEASMVKYLTTELKLPVGEPGNPSKEYEEVRRGILRGILSDEATQRFIEPHDKLYRRISKQDFYNIAKQWSMTNRTFEPNLERIGTISYAELNEKHVTEYTIDYGYNMFSLHHFNAGCYLPNAITGEKYFLRLRKKN